MNRPTAEVAPELLAKQHLDIGLIVNHKNKQVSPRPPLICSVAAALRGRTILKFGELAGLRIDLDRPAMLLDDDVVTDGQAKPVPSPAGLVVKNGLNIFSFTSGGMPVPLSRILISRCRQVLGRGSKRRLVIAAVCFRLALRRRIKAIGNQVEQHPRDLLRKQIDFAGGGSKDRSRVILKPCFSARAP